MVEGSGFLAVEDMGALDFETAVELVADAEDAIIILSSCSAS